MGIIKNTSTETGDVLYIQADAPIIGLLYLTDFLDDTTGESGPDVFDKQFRYSTDGVTYTDWLPLTIPNVAAIQVAVLDNFIVQYRYQNVSPTGVDLSFNSVTLHGAIEDLPCGPQYQRSIFKDFFSCHNVAVLNWCLNVTEKLYRTGLVPSFVDRGQSSAEDQDYLTFWKGVTKYFAFYVIYARIYQNFQVNLSLLQEWLTQRGLFICQEEDLQALLKLADFYHAEMFERGTSNVYQPSTTDGEAHGELLRLICYELLDEFIFNYRHPQHAGWCVGHASPMYQGTQEQLNCNKAYEDTQPVLVLSRYPLLRSERCNLVMDQGLQVLELDGDGPGGPVGIGALDLTKAIVVDPTLDYTIQVYVRQLELANNLSLGLIGLDRQGNQVDLQQVVDGAPNNFFFKNINLQREDKYLCVRAVVYNYAELSVYNVTKGYPQLKVVRHQGAHYEARRTVPAGHEPATSPTYWRLVPLAELQPILTPNVGQGTNLRWVESVAQVIPYLVNGNLS